MLGSQLGACVHHWFGVRPLVRVRVFVVDAVLRSSVFNARICACFVHGVPSSSEAEVGAVGAPRGLASSLDFVVPHPAIAPDPPLAPGVGLLEWSRSARIMKRVTQIWRPRGDLQQAGRPEAVARREEMR